MQEALTGAVLSDSPNDSVKICSVLSYNHIFFLLNNEFFHLQKTVVLFCLLDTMEHFLPSTIQPLKLTPLRLTHGEVHGIRLSYLSQDDFLPHFIYLLPWPPNYCFSEACVNIQCNEFSIIIVHF